MAIWDALDRHDLADARADAEAHPRLLRADAPIPFLRADRWHAVPLLAHAMLQCTDALADHAARAFFEWLLPRCDLAAPLHCVRQADGEVRLLPPLAFAVALLDTWDVAHADRARAVVERLLDAGADPARAGVPYAVDDEAPASLLCHALAAADDPALLRRLIDGGARLAEGEGPAAVEACLRGRHTYRAVATLRVLRGLPALLPTAQDQALVAEALAVWLRTEPYNAIDVLHELRVLGFRFAEPGVRQALEAGIDQGPPFRREAARRVLAQAEPVDAHRRLRTLQVQDLLRRQGLPEHLQHDLAAHANDEEAWPDRLGPMDRAARERARVRRVVAGRRARALYLTPAPPDDD